MEKVKQTIVLALIFFALVGMASAAAPTKAPDDSDMPAMGPVGSDEDDIGTVGGALDAAPVGGPVSAGTFTDPTPAPAPSSATALHGAATLAGVAAVNAASFLF